MKITIIYLGRLGAGTILLLEMTVHYPYNQHN
jgi:hypothetical protein